MGASTFQSRDARARDKPDRVSDRCTAPRRRTRRRAGLAAGLIASLLAHPLAAEALRVATYNTELSRRGPGLLLRDIVKGDVPDVAAVVAVIAGVRPDILFLQGIDFDLGGATLSALARALADAGIDYPYRFAGPPNSGLRTGLDLDGDGRTGGPRDAQGYGKFSGQGGAALLSRYPIDMENLRDFSGMLWADLPGAMLPRVAGKLFPDAGVYAVQRLSTVVHWDVPVRVDGQALHLLGSYATTPVFDGPEDRNGLRNRDELRLWQLYLDGALAVPPPDRPFVLLGDFNLDPQDGEGRRRAMQGLLRDPRLQDPTPKSAGGRAAAAGGVNAAQKGDPALDTADWDDAGPGNLRVDYVLPSSDLVVTGSGVVWPEGEEGALAAAASRHRLVWVDLELER